MKRRDLTLCPSHFAFGCTPSRTYGDCVCERYERLCENGEKCDFYLSTDWRPSTCYERSFHVAQFLILSALVFYILDCKCDTDKLAFPMIIAPARCNILIMFASCTALRSLKANYPQVVFIPSEGVHIKSCDPVSYCSALSQRDWINYFDDHRYPMQGASRAFP